MTALVAMVALALASWLFRVAFIVVVPAERLPARFRAALEYLAPAVLAALVVAEIDAAARSGGPGTAVLVVGCVAAVALVLRRTGSLWLAILIAGAAALLIDLVVLA